jgi:hypothetical protein
LFTTRQISYFDWAANPQQDLFGKRFQDKLERVLRNRAIILNAPDTVSYETQQQHLRKADEDLIDARHTMEPLRDKYDASRRCGDWSDPSFIRGGRGFGSGLVARSGLVVPRGCDAGSDRSDGHGILCFQLVAAGIRMVNSLIRWRHSNRNQRRNYGARTQGFG